MDDLLMDLLLAIILAKAVEEILAEEEEQFSCTCEPLFDCDRVPIV